MVEGLAERLKAIPREHTQTLPALHTLHGLVGYLPLEGLEEVAAWLRISRSELYAVATSYTEFRLEKPAPETVVVCSSLSCRMVGSADLVQALRAAGWTVEERACLFYCAVPPVVEVGGVVRGRASVEMVGPV